MADEPERPHDDPARSWDEHGPQPSMDSDPVAYDTAISEVPVDPATVGTGSYLAVSCVAGMGMLLVILIVGLLISRLLS